MDAASARAVARQISLSVTFPLTKLVLNDCALNAEGVEAPVSPQPASEARERTARGVSEGNVARSSGSARESNRDRGGHACRGRRVRAGTRLDRHAPCCAARPLVTRRARVRAMPPRPRRALCVASAKK